MQRESRTSTIFSNHTYRVTNDEDAVVLLDLAHEGFDSLPQMDGALFFPGEQARHLIVTDVTVH